MTDLILEPGTPNWPEKLAGLVESAHGGDRIIVDGVPKKEMAKIALKRIHPRMSVEILTRTEAGIERPVNNRFPDEENN